MTTASRQKAVKPPFANVYWFPLAAFYAIIALPWSVAGQFGWFPAPPGLSTPWGHGHEMLFGYALAVVAGYVLGPRPKKIVFPIIGVWLLGRISFLCWPGSWVSGVTNVAFIGMIAWQVLPSYLRTAKKWRNKSLGVIVLGLVFVVLGVFLALNLEHFQLVQLLLLEAIFLLSALMYFMGGRMLAPAIAGHLKKSKKIVLKDRVQPRVEGATLILLGLVLLGNLLPRAIGHYITAVLLIVCAVLIVVRALRWRIWLCGDRPDLLALLVGYFWLPVGWGLIAVSLLTQALPLTLAFHAITVGALGTLTLTVMGRSRMHRALKNPNAIAGFYLTVLLIAIATLLRLTVGAFSYKTTLLLAAASWSMAFIALFGLLIYVAIKERAQKVAST